MTLVYRTPELRKGCLQITRDETNTYWVTIPIQHSTITMSPREMADVLAAVAADLATFVKPPGET